MSYPIASSTSIISVTLLNHGARILDAVVTAAIYNPGQVITQPASSMAHIGNGVYQLALSPSAMPVHGSGYSVVLSITQGGRVFNPIYYFNVYEG